MEAALRATSDVGLFSTAAGAGQHLEVPEWKLAAYQRSQVAIWRAVSDISRRVEQQATWFFQVLEQDFDDELRGKVLQFTTGSSSMGREGLQIFRIDVAEGSDGRLPSAMTCGNLLQLPRYSSKVVLRRQLQTAVETTGRQLGD
ncbi:E3 ubiquitin-protein ligase ptr1 [Symbiodinium microadriaticum]|uniref:HECT-type E3 ubiquitin transferase n=1 Tax=Symbiodinium microadriaticum TaxID=2951 RepID=A0A1Q9D9L0_SYMMI|nr:E3 ubiquitin-protein ligase ptr1 [Symbiodinium microadriaticum]